MSHDQDTSRSALKSDGDQPSNIKQRLRRIAEHVAKLGEILSGVPDLDSSLDTIETEGSHSNGSHPVETTKTALPNGSDSGSPDQNIISQAQNLPGDDQTDELAGLVSKLDWVKDVVMDAGEWEDGEIRTVGEDFKRMVVEAWGNAVEIEKVVEQLRIEVRELKRE